MNSDEAQASGKTAAQAFAARINGREYPFALTKAEAAEAKAAGLVVVYGGSDDLMEFEGAIHDEIGAYNGTTATVTAAGDLLQDWDEVDHDDEEEAEAYFRKKAAGGATIDALWCPHGRELSWAYKTAIPHATFIVKEEGSPDYCEGIVFALYDVAALMKATGGEG